MTQQTTQDVKSQNKALQIIIIAGLVVAAFFGAFKFASARNGNAAQQPVAGLAQPSSAAVQGVATGSGSTGAGSSGSGAATGSGSAGCACCGGGSGQKTANGVTGTPVEGTAQISGGVQAIGVKVTTTYSPNVIKLKAGIPAEITFGQAAGCTGQVISQDLGFSEDLTSGPKVVKLPALKAGTYSFSCGMGMVFGKIVVE